MSKTQTNFAVNELKHWAVKQAKFFSDHKIENSYSSERPGFGNLKIELSDYLIDVCAWDNANCLDIQIIHLSSEKITLPTTGECESNEMFRDKLEELKAFVENNYE